MSDVVAVLTARTQSSRLPGKALMPLGGVPTIRHILSRVSRAGLPVVVAVPYDQVDVFRPYLDGYPEAVLFGGDRDSPLHRTSAALRKLHPEARYFVRLTHDDPLLDPETLLRLVRETASSGAGYGTAEIVFGAGAEVVAVENVHRAAEIHAEPTEFISYFIRGQGLPNPKVIRVPGDPAKVRPYRLTLDYPEDAMLLETVLRALGPDASVESVCALMDREPHLARLNRLPRVSLYTCARNAERWVAAAMGSAFDNLGENGEYVLVEDQSTDNTLLAMSSALVGRKKPSIIVNTSRAGLATSSNRAIASCKGEYIMRLDADDVLFPGAVSDLLRKADESEAVLIYPAYREMDESGVTLSGTVDPRINHHAGCCLMRKDFFNEVRFRDGLRNWDGLDLYRRAVARGARVAYVDEPLWAYRKRDGSMSSPSEERSRELEAL